MSTVTKTLFALLRAQIDGSVPPKVEREQIEPLAALAAKHDMAHLVANGLEQSGDLPPKGDAQGDALRRQKLLSVFRYEQLRYSYAEICEAFEKEKIPFLPLKGAVMRDRYPKGWMRTSCDVDVLVKEADLERATAVLCEQYNYEKRGLGSHDVSLFSDGGTHLELHYDLVEDARANDCASILSHVWEYAHPKAEGSYCYELSDEMFYFYHIAHMAKHFEIGGCGLRPFLDLWLLDRAVSDASARDALLEQGKLLQFAQVCRRLSLYWFSFEECGEADDATLLLERFILQGGMYGNTENRVMIQQKQKGGKLKFFFFRVFIPYKQLKFYYPTLQKHKWLLPFFWVRRWCRILFCGGFKKSMRELQFNQTLSQSEKERTEDLLRQLGL